MYWSVSCDHVSFLFPTPKEIGEGTLNELRDTGRAVVLGGGQEKGKLRK